MGAILLDVSHLLTTVTRRWYSRHRDVVDPYRPVHIDHVDETSYPTDPPYGMIFDDPLLTEYVKY
jgi:hypothetical protein